ncbi:MAG: hypothetical protein M3134_05910 [Actinomycetota bacterium]|nr:hypothetical protein [Actinomycetota bacterium]
METSTYPGTSSGTTSVGEQVREQAQNVAETVQDTAARAATQVQEQAQNLTGKARGQVRSQIDDRLQQVGDRVGSTAHDLRIVAGELRRIDKEQPAKLADQAAGRVERLGTYLGNADTSSILQDLENVGRRQPWAVIAGGITLGFIASRLLKATSSQRYSTSNTSTRSREEIRAGLEGSAVYSGSSSTAPPVPPAYSS